MKIKFFSTLRNYKKEYLKQDIFSGIIIAAVSIPISMGYAQIAGLPPAYGLYGSILPILLFAIFSTSRQFIFGVDAAPELYTDFGTFHRIMAPFLLFYKGRPDCKLHIYSCYGWFY